MLSTREWRLTGVTLLVMAVATGLAMADQARTKSGVVEGALDEAAQVRTFLGIPYAAAPVGDLRWRAPQPAPRWEGVRPAKAFGPRCTQGRIYDDMVFRDEVSEDCLYLNVWAPAKPSSDRLPVMVWVHGGGFQAGSASEPRQDGTHLAQKGVIVVGLNYRLGVFGFLAHPDLTHESEHKASGNYGLMDQAAALQWVHDNIAAFGGDPESVTIFGESAGSFSVSALMASPLAKGLFQRAIGESGAFFTVGEMLGPTSLADSERQGARFGEKMLGETSIAGMRAKSADAVLEAALRSRLRFGPNDDGRFLPKSVYAAFAAGEQAHVPLLAGWNADEIRSSVTLAPVKPTAARFAQQQRNRFGEEAEALLKVYPASTDEEALESAAALASDLFIGYATWKWIEEHRQTGQAPIYRYSFDRKIPVDPDAKVMGVTATAEDVGARHAGEIEYVFGALDSLPRVPWQPEDRKLSDLMMSYWSNFARSGDPNGPGLPEWPRYDDSASRLSVMHLDTTSGAEADTLKARYEVLDTIMEKRRSK